MLCSNKNKTPFMIYITENNVHQLLAIKLHQSQAVSNRGGKGILRLIITLKKGMVQIRV
jgi:hypothetical protein